MTTLESPLLRFEKIEGAPPQRIEGSGGVPFTSYFELAVRFPDIIHAPEEDLTDCEVLQLAESVGTFEFLNSPEEDVYTLPVPQEPQP